MNDTPSRRTSADRQHHRENILCFFAVMVNAAKHLPPEDYAELQEFERTSDGPTSDWPRWGEFIDLNTFWPYPWKPGEQASPKPSSNKWYASAPLTGIVLYRLFTDNDRLLYIGISRATRARMRTHHRRWPGIIHHATYEPFDTLEDALRAETLAIQSEDPAINIAKSLSR